jgi:hypothetical protein
MRISARSVQEERKGLTRGTVIGGSEGPAGPGELGIWSWLGLVRCRKSDNLTVKYHWTKYIVSWCPSGIVCWMRISARSVQEERKGLTEGPGTWDFSCLVRCRKSDNLTVDITEQNTLEKNEGGYSVDPAKWGYQQDQFKRRERALHNEKWGRMFRICWGSHVTQLKFKMMAKTDILIIFLNMCLGFFMTPQSTRRFKPLIAYFTSFRPSKDDFITFVSPLWVWWHRGWPTWRISLRVIPVQSGRLPMSFQMIT